MIMIGSVDFWFNVKMSGVRSDEYESNLDTVPVPGTVGLQMLKLETVITPCMYKQFQVLLVSRATVHVLLN